MLRFTYWRVGLKMMKNKDSCSSGACLDHAGFSLCHMIDKSAITPFQEKLRRLSRISHRTAGVLKGGGIQHVLLMAVA